MIAILRLGHRPERDKRITTHIGLVARAFGADEMVIDGSDASVEESINGITKRFGGDFTVTRTTNWRRIVKDWNGTVVHLTMYGEHIDDALPKIPIDKDLLLVVGAEKVPREIYEWANFNVAIGNQPHSEVGALAVFLDRYQGGKGLKKEFDGAMKIIPNKRGKTVIER